MKITKTRLKEIIKEEIEAASEEGLHPITILKRLYIEIEGVPFGETKIPHYDKVEIERLGLQVVRKEITMVAAKEKVSEMADKNKEKRKIK